MLDLGGQEHPAWFLPAHHSREPACWEWDASPSAVGRLRQELLDERAARAPAGTSSRALAKALDWELLIVWHQKRCAMCGQVVRLVMDHDHESGFLRGLLCVVCNIGEGHHSETRTRRASMGDLDDPPNFSYQRYRDVSPASILGVRHRYASRNAFPAWSRLARRQGYATDRYGTHILALERSPAWGVAEAFDPSRPGSEGVVVRRDNFTDHQ